MGLRKTVRAAPIRRGGHYRPNDARRARKRVISWIAGAALGGVTLGAGSAATTETGRQRLSEAARSIAIEMGVVRRREPQAGDDWRNCDSARAAGTAPIYRGEPGYREWLDRDADGIACEPYRGR
ncbi:hypothetical protein DMC47_04315 [Nostoc sp. 3335mG]|nr:hypothetical protein DMC47_04315 [Nostoc sp. 3335mG]